MAAFSSSCSLLKPHILYHTPTFPSKRRMTLCFLRRGSTTATTESTATEAGSELARSPFLIITASVATLTRGAGSRTTLALFTTKHTTRRSVGALLLDVGSRNNLGRKVQPFTQVVETLKEGEDGKD